MAHSEDVKPEDIFVRVVLPPTSGGCILLDHQVTDKFDYSAVLRYRVLYWQCKPIHNRLFGISDLDEIKTATLLNSTLSAEKFDALTLEVTSLTPQGGKWSGRVDVKVRLIMNDLSSLDELQMHPSMQTSLIRINPNPLSMVLMNPKVLEVRISLSPIQLRDILSHHMIDLPREAFYKVLKVPCQCKLVMFVSRLRVENVMAFSSSDLMEGRVYLIPSVNCSKETVDNQLSILQQITNTRGLNHQQSLTVRINISPRRHIISFRNLTIGIGEKVSMKESKLHISETDEEGSVSTIIGCRSFSTENDNDLESKSTQIDEIFRLEEPPTCGKLSSKRLNRTVGMFSMKNLLENDIYFEHNGKETCNSASITISGIIRGEVETRVPRQKIVFFVLVRGVPVHLVRFEPPQMWWGSVVEISSSHLAAQLTAAYADLEANDYIPIEYRVKSLQGGVISSSASEVIPVSVFTDQDIRQRRVNFHHDEKSPNAGFKFTLVHGDYESSIHQFNIEIKCVKSLFFKINPIVGHVDSLTKVSITNINAIVVLNSNKSYDLVRACEYGGLQVSYVVSNAQTPCYFVLRMDYSNSSLQADSFTQCDIYRGQVQMFCGVEALSTVILPLKAQVIEPISSTIRRAIYNSEKTKLKVVIRERVNETSRKIAHINPKNPEDLYFEDIKMYDVGYTVYQPKESSVNVLKTLPIHGTINCDNKVMKIGDALCKSPVYKSKGGLGILDTISFEAFPNSGKSSHSALIKMPIIIHRGNLAFGAIKNPIRPMKRFIHIIMNNSFESLNSELRSEIDGAVYTITKFPSFGGVYLNGSLARSFSSFFLERCEIYYERNFDYLSDFTRDHIRVVVCSDWPECQANTQVLEIQVDAFPEEKRIVFRDLHYDPQKKYIPIRIEKKSLRYDTFLLALKPKFGRILSNNVDILKLDARDILDDRISYYRTEWNMSNDEFTLQRQNPPLVMIFRVITVPLIRFKTLYVPHGKEFILNARMLDILPLLDSVDRLKRNGFIDKSLSLQEALRFSISRSTSIGKFTKSQDEEYKTKELRFTYKELSDEAVKFKNHDNVTVRSTSEDTKISILAPMFMAPQKIPIKISIMSTQYNVQDNILLSDFVDEIGAVDSPIGTPIYDLKQREFGNSKIWFAIAIGIICFIVCIFVTVAYFYLRRWRNQRRIQARCATEPIAYVDSYQPKASRMIDREDEPLPSPIMLVPLSVIGSQSTNLQTNAEAVLTDQIVHWERQSTKQDIPSTSFYVIRGEAIAEDGEAEAHPIPCIVSKTPLTTNPLTQIQSI